MELSKLPVSQTNIKGQGYKDVSILRHLRFKLNSILCRLSRILVLVFETCHFEGNSLRTEKEMRKTKELGWRRRERNWSGSGEEEERRRNHLSRYYYFSFHVFTIGYLRICY